MSQGRSSVRILLAAALALAVVATLGVTLWRRSSRAAPPPPLATNVVVLLADTLRADHLSLYGYPRATSPLLDARAGRAGVVFDSARAQAPCTFPSVNSILTSVSPGLFFAEMRRFDSMAIPARVPTLAQVLADAGFDTAAVSASPIVRATPSRENPGAGFDAGFHRFDESCLWKDGFALSSRAAEILPQLHEPFFLYVHYMDPHDPYASRPRADGRPRFAEPPPPGPVPDFLLAGDPDPIARRIYREHRDPGITPEQLDYLIARYDDDVYFWDWSVAQLLHVLEQSGRASRTVVAVVADHGEEFLEHGDIKHCRSLYEAEVHVPLVFFVPGLAPRRVVRPVSNLDVMPTLLDLVGVAPRGLHLEGRSLRPLLTGRGDLPPALQFAAWGAEQSASDGRYKLIRDAKSRSLRLFDLLRDPGERTDLADARPEVVDRLRRALFEWYRLHHAGAREGADETARRLRALGYLQ